MPALYDLTPYTGSKKSEERRTVVAAVETRNRSLVTTGIGFLVALPLVGVLLPMIGTVSLLAPAATIPITHMLVARRRRGLQVSNLHALDNHLAANRGWSLRGALRRDRGVHARNYVITIAGEPFHTPRLVDVQHVYCANPDYRPPTPASVLPAPRPDPATGPAPEPEPVARGTTTATGPRRGRGARLDPELD